MKPLIQCMNACTHTHTLTHSHTHTLTHSHTHTLTHSHTHTLTHSHTHTIDVFQCEKRLEGEVEHGYLRGGGHGSHVLVVRPMEEAAQ
ncbi:hypothetical protein GQ43DRAFT_217771 [Delitschia confertaspora ATCC 74209]|uniref:Uncharacterized protein n=1 Tax=Delitschia confertaspora ATCC 74209 TaxID=1513339 RepID=A0A9P4JIC8_9PLEO|nr:hypothetical protein GQ43DRAFT_217771 [Delitschia confertaspora ATCC 74209]